MAGDPAIPPYPPDRPTPYAGAMDPLAPGSRHVRRPVLSPALSLGRRRPLGRGRLRRSAAGIVIAGLLLTACGGDDGSKATDGVASSPAPMPEPGLAFPGERGDVRDEVAADLPISAPGAPDGPLDGQDGQDGRAVIRNASIELIVDDGAAAIDRVAELAGDFGGYVAGTFLSRAEDGTVSGSLTLRVPSEELDALVAALDALARAVPFRSIDESDVTMQLSDLDARIANLRAFERELLELLTEVRQRDGTVEGLVTVADRLREVRTEIDVIEGRRRQLADQVALSTVYVSVQQARSTTPVIGTWDLPGVVRDALATTLRLGQLAVEGVVWLALTVLPALIVVLVAVRSVSLVRRRRAQRPDAAAAPGAGPTHG